MAAIFIQLPADKIQIPANRHPVNHRVLSKCTTFQEFWAQTACLAESEFYLKVSSVPLAMRNFAKRYNTKKFVVVTERSFKETEDAFFIPLYLFELFIQNNKLLKDNT